MTSSNERRTPSQGREADLLAHEAAVAQAAVLEALQDLKSGLATAADPRLWAQQHPWAAIGVAAAAGFAAATLLVPSPEQNLKEKLSELLRGVQPVPRKPDGNGDATIEPRAASGPLAMVMESLLDLSKTAITNFVVAAMHKSSEAPDSNHQPGDAAPVPQSEPTASEI